MRGCIRRCKFCGTWRIEPKLTAKDEKQLIQEIISVGKNKVIFFDNNFFANPHIKKILVKLRKIRVNDKPVIFESQSGFDGRLLEKDPSLAELIKKARFKSPRIAWDHGFEEAKSIKNEIKYLLDVGYSNKDIFVFMIYNFDIPFEKMLKKLNYARKLGVQTIDCRFRPLDSTYDNYNPHLKEQTSEDYYIHTEAGWTDSLIRKFRRKVREQNIGLRYGKNGVYVRDIEKRYSVVKGVYRAFSIESRTPRLDELDASKTKQKRLRMLKKTLSYCRKNKIGVPDLSGYKEAQICERLLNRLINSIGPA
jgi:hypothetical protein